MFQNIVGNVTQDQWSCQWPTPQIHQKTDLNWQKLEIQWALFETRKRRDEILPPTPLIPWFVGVRIRKWSVFIVYLFMALFCWVTYQMGYPNRSSWYFKQKIFAQIRVSDSNRTIWIDNNHPRCHCTVKRADAINR